MIDRKLHVVYFHGSLASKYGNGPFEVFARDTKDIFRGLVSRFGPYFKETILHGAWHITKGKKEDPELKSTDNFMGEEEVELPVLEEEIHVFPAITGSGGNVGKIIIGVVLIVIAVVLIVFTAGAASALVGAGLAATETIAAGIVANVATALVLAGISSIAGGVIGLLTKTPSIGSYSSIQEDQKQSFLFNGVVNNTEQGVPIPRVYGEFLTGSTVINAYLDVIQLLP